MKIQEMAEAHLKNVQQQIKDLQENRARLEADIQTLSEYLQQGVAELNSGNSETLPEPGVLDEADGTTVTQLPDRGGGALTMTATPAGGPSLTLPPGSQQQGGL